MDEETALKIHLQLRRLHDSPNISTIDGSPIGAGTITHCTEPIILQLSYLHYESISFLVTKTPYHTRCTMVIFT